MLFQFDWHASEYTAEAYISYIICDSQTIDLSNLQVVLKLVVKKSLVI